MNKKSLHSKLILKVMLMMMALLFLFALGANYIGYQQFTTVLTAQYADNAICIAKQARNMVEVEDLDGFIGSEGTNEVFQTVFAKMTELCNAMDANYIYGIKVDTSDYGHITFAVSTTNDRNGSKPFSSGYIMQTTNEEYARYYQEIYEDGLEEAIVVRDQGLRLGAKPHITALVPLWDLEGNVVAIMAAEHSMDYLNSARADFLRHICITALALFIFGSLVYGLLVHRFLVQPILDITDETQRFARENTMGGIPLSDRIKTKDEIRTLANAVDEMERQTLAYFNNLTIVTAEKERIGAELDVATHIQKSMLPSIFPAFPEMEEMDIYAIMEPAKEVGGDFYDFFMVDATHLAVVVADVSGKGVPAALFMVIAKTLIKDHTTPESDLGRVFTEVNNILCASNAEGLFVTAFEGILDLETGEFTYVNAGHEQPFICRAGGNFEVYKVKPAFVLAGMEDIVYKSGRVTLEPGDSFFQYSDGVTEATNTVNELFGMKRLQAALNREPDADLMTLLSNVRADMDQFVGEAPQFDDITMLGFTFVKKK